MWVLTSGLADFISPCAEWCLSVLGHQLLREVGHIRLNVLTYSIQNSERGLLFNLCNGQVLLLCYPGSTSASKGYCLYFFLYLGWIALS